MITPAPDPGTTLEFCDPDRVRWRRALLVILCAAAALRIWGALHDLPFSFYGDELYLMKRAMAMGTGDLNPHWFHKPALLMYLLTASYGAYFAVGAALGRFDSVQAFGAHFLNDAGPFLLIGRLLVVTAGVGVVWVAGAIARRAFRSTAAGIAASAAAAVLTPLVSSSQEIKSDVPCAFLIALAIYFYLDVERSARRWFLARAAFTGGVALGMHYYAIILLPAMALAEMVRARKRRLRLTETVGRLALLGTLFVGGFFVSSPFNFLDPSATAYYTGKVSGATTTEARFEPDQALTFEPGAPAMVAALQHFGSVLTREANIGWLLLVLIVAGMIEAARRAEARTLSLLVVVPCALFVGAAVVLFPFHAAPRHLTAFLPLLCTLTWPGASLIARSVTRQGAVRTMVASAVVVLAGIVPAAATIALNREVSRLDSRVAAYRWLLANVPRDARILLDDYGPILNPSSLAVERLNGRLQGLPAGPFTQHQTERLALLRRYPAADGFNLDELGHQWWLSTEKTNEALRSTPSDMDMGNPLVSRVPESCGAYRQQGFRYVVSNSDAAGRYKRFPDRFPSFARFYRELSQLTPVQTFDPAAWHGKGPIVWVFDLDAPSFRTCDDGSH
jgi:hypothetical protein